MLPTNSVQKPSDCFVRRAYFANTDVRLTQNRCLGKHAYKLSQKLGTKWTMNIESTNQIVWIVWAHRDTWRLSWWQFGAHGPQTVNCWINWCVKYDSVCGAKTQNANRTNDRQPVVENFKQDESVWTAKSRGSFLLISVHVLCATVLTDSIESGEHREATFPAKQYTYMR